MRVVQLVESDMDEEVLLGECHILVHLRSSRQLGDLEGGKVEVTATNLKSIVEVSDLAQIIQKLVDPSFVVFNEGIERDHVGFLRVRGFVRQILEHFGNLRGNRLATHFKLDRQQKLMLTNVKVRRGCFAGTPSTNMYAWGVTTAGLINRKKKNPPISEQIA
jgi:hypothetical protein